MNHHHSRVSLALEDPIALIAALPEDQIDSALRQLRGHIYALRNGASLTFRFNPSLGQSFALEGGIVPKARPRHVGKISYLPGNYRDWKDAAIWELRSQYHGEPLSGVEVAITLVGKHSRRGDADNIEGSILDALVQAGVLHDDSLMHVPALSLRLKHSKAPAVAQIVITDYIHH